jgi:hypothetical protein
MQRPQYGDANWAPSEGSSTQLELRIKQQRNSSLRKPPRSGSQFQQRWRWISPSRAHWPGNQVPPPEWGTVREKKQSEEGGEGGIQSGSRALTVRARRDSSLLLLVRCLPPSIRGAAEQRRRAGGLELLFRRCEEHEETEGGGGGTATCGCGAERASQVK